MAHDAAARLDLQKKTVGAAERDEVARQAWREEVAAWVPADVVVLDETGTNVALVPKHARAPRTERAYDVAPFNKGGNITTLATLTTAGIAAAMTVSGAAGSVSLQTVSHCLPPRRMVSVSKPSFR